MSGNVGAQGRQQALQFARRVHTGRFCGAHHYISGPLGPTMGVPTPALFLWAAQDAASSAKILALVLYWKIP